MRIQSALGVSLSLLLSCTAENPAYSASDGGTVSATALPSTASSAGSTATSNSGPETQGVTSDTTSGAQGTTITTTVDNGSEHRCWLTPIAIATESLRGDRERLMAVPLRIETSRLDPASNLETLRFYQDGVRLPYELEGQGRFAWVRAREIRLGDTAEIQAIIGAECSDVPERLPTRAVWSADYVAVFHFDSAGGSPLRFLDSVEGIELLHDASTEAGQSDWFLGPYARKLGDQSFEATDGALELAGETEISTLGWVLLDSAHAAPEPWSGDSARHREVIAKLPGYRLTAVAGQTAPRSNLPPTPLFTLTESLLPDLHDNVFGLAPVPAEQWTMLSGTYDGEVVRLFVGDEVVGTTPTPYTLGTNGNGEIRVGRWLRGGVDEIRISNVARTPAWIRIQHASMTGTLLEYGLRQQLDP